MEEKDVKKIVRESYGKIAEQSSNCCAPTNSCCGSSTSYENIGKKIGYTDEDLRNVPEGANLGLGCGNPVALASLKEGDHILDLGSGAGFDCFLAANRVGKSGKVIGVDMTPDMIDRARENVEKGKYENVEFRLGEIENLPVADNSVDAIISNCVINLSPEKERVFQEAFRVLKPGGRMMVSDIVLLKELPEFIKNNSAAYVSCVAGAVLKEQYLEFIREAGFQDIDILGESTFTIDLLVNQHSEKGVIKNLNHTIQSIKIQAIKPKYIESPKTH